MAQTLEGKHVLLVDDDNDILTSMQAAFEPTGATVEMANNGNKAVELAEKGQFSPAAFVELRAVPWITKADALLEPVAAS